MTPEVARRKREVTDFCKALQEMGGWARMLKLPITDVALHEAWAMARTEWNDEFKDEQGK